MRAAEEPPRGRDLPVVRVVRWVARIVGSLLVMMVLAFMIGEGLPNPLVMSSIELATSLAFLIMIVGLLLAWRREGLGGALTVGGFLAFWALHIASSHRFGLGGPFPAFPVAGFLHLFCWRQSIRTRNLDRW